MSNPSPTRFGQRLLALARGSVGSASKRDEAWYRGHWVALDHCRYEEAREQPSSGRIVDSDLDLGDLCERLRATPHRRCVVVRVNDGYRLDTEAREPTLTRSKDKLSPAA